jgi:mono/diheme cytochrome c family protein
MMKSIGIALALLLAGSMAVMAQGNAANGKQLFVKQNCARCHGSDGQGGAGKRLTPNPPSTEALIKYVHKPTGTMPAYGNNISDSDLTDIRAYLASIPPPPAVKDVPLLNQ